MGKKILSPEEREKAAKVRKARRLVAYGCMMNDAVMETMRRMIRPETGFSGLSEFESLKAVNGILDYNIGKDQDTQLIYICAPDTEGDEETAVNEENALFYGHFAAALGMIPVMPKIMWSKELFDSSEESRSFRLRLCMSVMTGCDAVWVFRNGADTGEMEAEILLARLLKKPIRVIKLDP